MTKQPSGPIHPCNEWIAPIIAAIETFPVLRAIDLPDALERHARKNPYNILVVQVRSESFGNRLERLREWLQFNGHKSDADEVNQRVARFLERAETWTEIAHWHATGNLDCERRKHNEERLELSDWLGDGGSAEELWLEIEDEGSRLTAYLKHLSANIRAQIAIVNPKPTPTQPPAMYTVAALRDMTGLANTTLNKYAKLAKMPTPPRGKRNHRYTANEVRAILKAILAHGSEAGIMERCRNALVNLR